MFELHPFRSARREFFSSYSEVHVGLHVVEYRRMFTVVDRRYPSLDSR